MKATELQLGNIVCFATRPFIIDGISVGGGSVHSDKEGWQPTSEITPYPLTPEILEKNGWLIKWGDDERRYPIYATFVANDMLYEYYFHEGLLRSFYNDELVTRFPSAMHYVHIFQHALRMCGIDKEIVL